jgi:hypothetical protein
MDQTALRSTNRFLFNNTKDNFAILDQYAITKDGIRGLWVQGSLDVDTVRNDHAENLLPRRQGFWLDNGRYGHVAIPARDPRQDVLNLIPVQEPISQRELADTAKGVLHDAHNRLIGLRRDDLCFTVR